METAMQYVTFIAGGETFAVEMAPVQEIIRVPEVVRVPLAPAALDGLANLRGQVLPIVDLRRVCGFDETTRDDATRALVLDYGEPLGFVVDRVVSVIAVDPSSLAAADDVSGGVRSELLSGLLTGVGDHDMIMVLDFRKIIAREFADILSSRTRALGDASLAASVAAAGTSTEPTADELQLVSFHVDGQEYAMAIDAVQEIVPLPETLVRVPHTDAHVVGMMTLRERVLPLVSLRRLFAMGPAPDGARERVVVMTVGGELVGVVTDSVSEVLRVPRTLLEAVPRLLAHEGDAVSITQLARLDDGRRLVSVLDAQALFRHERIRQAVSGVAGHDRATDSHPDTNDEASVMHDRASVGTADDEQFVILRLGRDEFGVPIGCVQEIVRLPDELTRVPKAPDFVEGVINLRGAVLPVVDLRRRLGLPAIGRTEGQRVMVFTIDGVRTGFIVDAVAEVLSVPVRAIGDAPRLSSEQGTLLSRMANLDAQRRIVQLIDPAFLLSDLHRHDLQELPLLPELAAA